MSEPPVNIVKLAVGVQSVEELALIQKQFLNQPGIDTNRGFYHSTKLMPKKHEAIIKSGSQLIAKAITTLCRIPPLNWCG